MIEVEINQAYLSGREFGKDVWNLIRDEEEVCNRTNSLEEVIKFRCGNEYIRSLVRIYSECYKK